MRITKRLLAFVIMCGLIISMIPLTNANADSEIKSISDINIISNTKVTIEQAEKWAQSKNATKTFIDLAKLYWEYAKKNGGVNPGIAYVQAAKETGYGKFGGVLNESYKNPCGMKTSSGGGDYDPNAHQKFNSWDEGVQAHLDHLALYAGAAGYPRKNTYDPRHFASIKGKAPTVNSLGGKWAPSATYGEEINKLYNELLSFSGNASVPDVTPDDSDKDDSNSGEIIKPNDTIAPNGPAVTEPIKIINDNTPNITSKIGWKLEKGKWYYYKSDGKKATGWIKPGAEWYYLYSNGEMATGWEYLWGTWYYFKSYGGMQLGWLKSGSTWYYFQGDGSMVTGFKLINSKTYFFDTSGAMRVGWFKISGRWYYFNTDGYMMTGWIRPGKSWNYLFNNGIMATGWLAVGGEWYYIHSNGDMATGWISDGSAYYYLNPSSGKMARATTVDGWEIGPDGKRGNRLNGGTSMLIVIDPGHNFGGDDGAYATHNGITYCERDLNMQVALKLKTKLEDKGYQVVLTRKENDRETVSLTQSLTARANLANSINADFFISLHHNSAGTESANGVETYYSTKPQDSSFGGATDYEKMQKSRSIAVAINNSIASKTGAYNRGAKDGNYFVLRNTNMPSVLVEFGFISNPTEAAKCADSNYQNLSTTGVAEAISNNF